jgi:hypothetical protein
MEKNNILPRFLIIAVMILMIIATPTGHASAALRGCRTDPIFSLSNGDKLTITLDISTDAINIRNVTYILHVPAGVTVKSVVYTAGGLGTKEVYKVYQDSAAMTYKTESLVTVQNTGSVPMVSMVKLNSLTAKSASGYTGQYVVVTVSKP